MMFQRLSLRTRIGLLLALALLAGCSSYSPPAMLIGMGQDEVVAKMGSPDTVRKTGDGTRFEFPRGPFGKHTWFIYFDATGRATHAEQVLTEQNFMHITPDMAEEEVRQRLGRPNQVQGLARERGEVWSYRFENPFCRWFQVELSLEKQVRSAGYGEPPECNRSSMNRLGK